jgi:hypothetical protein
MMFTEGSRRPVLGSGKLRDIVPSVTITPIYKREGGRTHTHPACYGSGGGYKKIEREERDIFREKEWKRERGRERQTERQRERGEMARSSHKYIPSKTAALLKNI